MTGQKSRQSSESLLEDSAYEAALVAAFSMKYHAEEEPDEKTQEKYVASRIEDVSVKEAGEYLKAIEEVEHDEQSDFIRYFRMNAKNLLETRNTGDGSEFEVSRSYAVRLLNGEI